MLIFDAHTHLWSDGNPQIILSAMERSGVYGGCVFSDRPEENNQKHGKSFEKRLRGVLESVQGYEDRLFPVLWIHPYEDDIINKIHIAVDRGIAAFKIICSNFYVYEEKCLEVLREIASLDKPVFFHTGILWDGQVSSGYNRPVNWEALIDIKGLRFSMGHVSWPWCDECIALYGKFLNANVLGETAEMFIDITPGTPEIYREEVLTKIFKIGYDFGDNLLFGTDCTAESYNSEWAKKWIDTDCRIMDKLSVGKQVRAKLYHDNLMRFLGKTDKKITKSSPVPDNANTWNPHGEDTRDIIETWYKKLGFPKEFDCEFYAALEQTEIGDYLTADTYDMDCTDGRRNLLAYLYFCEETANKYRMLGIGEKYLIDNLYDIVTWTKIWSKVKGSLYLGELAWLKRHLSCELFKIGRLQFGFGVAEYTDEQAGIKKGERIIEIHIPERGRLDISECTAAISAAKEFFAKYFPSYEYTFFTCHSWLLGDTPKQVLKSDSNIIRFANLFNIISVFSDDSAIRYVLGWDATRENISQFTPTSDFAQKIQQMTQDGKDFSAGYGIIRKD